MNQAVTDKKMHPENRAIYIAAFVTSLSGVLAIAFTVASLPFLLLASFLLFAGYVTSVRLRAQNRNLRIVESIVIAICLATYARLFATGDTNPILSPGNALYHKELSLAVMLVWAEVVRSYSLVTDESLLFACVPSLALIGVVATTNPGPETLLFFTIWLCAAIALFATSATPAAFRVSHNRLRTLSVPITVGLLAVVIGSLFSPFIHRASLWAFVSFAPDLYASRHSNDLTIGDPENNILEISEGPVKLSQRVVMTVQSPVGTYWRSRVWSDYSGRDWKADNRQYTVEGVPYPDSTTSRGVRFRYDANVPENSAVSYVEQTFNFATQTENYLPGAGDISTVWIEASELTLDAYNSWKLTGRTGGVRTYSVRSAIPVPTEQQLRSAPAEYPARLHRRYTRMLMDSGKVRELAQSVTAGRRNQFDKIRALQEYLSQNCTYDLQTPPMPSRHNDAVEYFLFTSKRGYCDVFSTSLAMMARSIGIPARIATGYMKGEYNAQDSAWVVRERDRHSWTEVYFPGYGWIPFEATPSGIVPEIGFWQSLLLDLRSIYFDPNSRVGFMIAAICLGIVGLRSLMTVTKAPLIARTSRKQSPELRQTLRRWNKLRQKLNRSVICLGEGATPHDFAVEIQRLYPGQAEMLAEALEIISSRLNMLAFSVAPDVKECTDDLDIVLKIAGQELRKIRRERKSVSESPGRRTTG